MESEFYTKVDLRQLFGCSSRTLERWVVLGRIPKPALPGRWLRVEIREYLDSLRHSATSSDITKKTY